MTEEWPPPIGDPAPAASSADHWEAPTDAEVLAEAASRRRTLWLITAGMVLGVATAAVMDPSDRPGAGIAAKGVIAATAALYFWFYARTSRCPACEGYVHRLGGHWFRARTCPHCHVRLR